MARSPAAATSPTALRRRRAGMIASSLTLAAWRLRQMWKLLLVAGLGNIAAVLLVCIVPLFTEVALDAGVRGILSGPADRSQIIINGFGQAPTQQDITNIQQQLDAIVAGDLGPYAGSGAPQFSITLQDVSLLPAAGSSSSPPPGIAQVSGVDAALLATQYTFIEGRAPTSAGATLEIALTQADAASLNARVGSTLRGQIPGPQTVTVNMRVVGIVAPNKGQPVNQRQVFGSGPVYVGSGAPNVYFALTSNQAIFATLAKNGVSGQNQQGGPPQTLTWIYPVNTSLINANAINDILDRLGKVQTDVNGQLNGAQGLQGIYLDSGAYQELTNLRIQILVLQIPLLLLLLQVFALVLLFIRMMADLLVDRQADAIATLRSRGATRRQIFNAFTLHNIGLSLIALVVAPLIAIPIVRALSVRTLPPASQSAVDAISGNPLVVAYGLRWYVLVAVVVSAFAMIISTNRAASNNILTLRRENARTTTKPFWQRLNLDLIFGGLSLIGYVAYTIVVRQVSPRVEMILSPISLIAALLMLVAAALLFLRVLPPLLGVGARLATRGRGATSMLALTQMTRAPKQPIRMTLLLALSTAFTIFTLVYSASQAQRLADVAAYAAGADFSGTLPGRVALKHNVAEIEAMYRQIPGVTAASAGYTVTLNPNQNPSGVPLQIIAVDADTYAQSALWPTQHTGQPLSSLMAQLRDARATATTTDTVPAILDDATWQALHLTPGARFTLQPPGYDNSSMSLVALGHTPHIPTVYDSYQGGGFSGFGGLLVDYQSYAAVSRHDQAASAQSVVVMPTTAWIASRDDAASVASVRKALSSGSLALTSLQDYRKLIDDQRNNPLQIDMANTLLIGAATALTLALIGIWVGSWLNARGRVVNFAVLRALGSTPRQIRSMLVWEQAIIYIAGGALGVALGAVLSLTALPMLIFVELATRGDYLNVPNIPAARVVVPGGTLALALGALTVICVLALILTMGALARLSLGQTLRLNED